ncbi:MAG: hypothetical protein ABI852_02985 [Gemmatimonadaceae bacterium]
MKYAALAVLCIASMSALEDPGTTRNVRDAMANTSAIQSASTTARTVNQHFPAALHVSSYSRATDSAETHERLLFSISEFHAAWQQAWRDSETARNRSQRARSAMRLRLPFLHCHNDGRDFGALNGMVSASTLNADSVATRNYRVLEITSKDSRYAVCPSWLLTTSVDLALDESLGRDGALLDSLRAPIQLRRAKLLTQLDSGAEAWPRDGWIAGQRVRLYLDQDDATRAIFATKTCRAAAWWCAALAGYVDARKGGTVQAELMFEQMRKDMPTAVRCSWEDISNLFAPTERKNYEALSCDARIASNIRLWWLADPLYRTRANERRVEHDMRRVEIALRKDVLQDERYTWVAKEGGDVLAQMIERYGWPVYTAWAGFDEDTNHTGYLDGFSSPPMAPYTTFEYSLDRVHTIPPWQFVAAPFTVTASSWKLREENAKGEPVTTWWPDEHFRPARPLVQLAEGQTAMFRRQSQAIVAVAAQLNHAEVAAEPSAKFAAMLLTSTAPDKVDSLAEAVGAPNTTVALRGLVDAKARIMSFEIQGIQNSAVDARTRFAVTPPPPLDSMKLGDVAISDPALLRVDADAMLPPASEELLDRMLGTVHLTSKLRRVGVYWETYGVSAGDTVKVSVRVIEDAQISAVRRLGMNLNVADNPNRAIMQQWTEPDAQRGTRTLDGPIPVQVRTIVLNLSQLQPGPYVLEVGIERKDGTTATGRRQIFIEP